MNSFDQDKSAIGSTPAQVAFDQAVVLHEQNYLTEAAAFYEAALALEPQRADILASLGLLRLQQNRAGDSITLLRRAIEQDPHLVEAHTDLGAALQSLGSHAEALACHDTALALAPDLTEAMRRRAHALQSLGRVAEAMDCYEAVLAQHPDDARSQLGLATALVQSDREDEAFVRYRNAASLDPTLADHLSQALAAFAQRHKKTAEAGSRRLNRYIGAFLTNYANPRMGAYPGLTSARFHEPARLAGVSVLERNYDAIRAEIEGLAANVFHAEAEGLMERGAWDVFLFNERGKKNMENSARCPVITRVIEGSNTVRTIAGLLYVSKLGPGTRIKPHRGPTNLRLRCHLGIKIPDGDCGLTVGGETRRWQEGKCMVFDDLLEHEAWNHTSQPRIVLILDFWHPDLNSSRSDLP